MDFLSGRYRHIERELEQRMRAAADDQLFEQAALERNRLHAVRALLERQRVASESVGTLDAIAVAIEGRRRQRPGLPGPRRRALRPPVLLPRQRGRARARRGGRGVHPPVLRHRHVDPAAGHRPARPSRTPALAEALSAAPRRRRSRCARPSAVTSAASSSWPSATRASRSTRSACATSAGARAGSRRSTACRRRSASTPSRCVSRLRHLQPRRHAHGRLDGRVRGRRTEEVRLPPLPHPLARGGLARRLRGDGGGAGAPARALRAPARPLAARPRVRRVASQRCPT